MTMGIRKGGEVGCFCVCVHAYSYASAHAVTQKWVGEEFILYNSW